MDFCAAVGLMKQGISVTRTFWDNQEEYITLEDDVFIKHNPDVPNPFPIIFFSHEILATDWEVVRQRTP